MSRNESGRFGALKSDSTDFVCLYTYEFWLSLCKIVRSSVILLLPLFIMENISRPSIFTSNNNYIVCSYDELQIRDEFYRRFCVCLVIIFYQVVYNELRVKEKAAPTGRWCKNEDCDPYTLKLRRQRYILRSWFFSMTADKPIVVCAWSKASNDYGA